MAIKSGDSVKEHLARLAGAAVPLSAPKRWLGSSKVAPPGRGPHAPALQGHPVGVMQPKMILPPVAGRPLAPPPYRPQAIPRVLQAKRKAETRIASARLPSTPVLRNAVHTGLQPVISRPGLSTLQARKNAVNHDVRQAGVPRTAPLTGSVQRFASATVQATKYYPNLHPGAVEPVDPSNIFKLDSFADQYRLHKVHSHGVNVPNQQYNFVRTREGEMLLHSRYRHPSIAEGKQVLYAGEIFFNNGKLQWWSNGSGHYQPDPDDATQANLPMDQFFSYQQIIKGEHMRRQ